MPYKDSEQRKAYDVDGEYVLWVAVLRLALRDATAPHAKTYHSQAGPAAMDQEDARDFLTNPERFGSVCEALEIDVDFFQRWRDGYNVDAPLSAFDQYSLCDGPGASRVEPQG